ncbi:MAG: hypothetical protein HPZ91_07660 [Lentisphaeria bacterium]|nr:hypothetical protein [Lentisphaeria bacterium]
MDDEKTSEISPEETASAEPVKEEPAAVTDKAAECAALENEAYRRHMEALNAELVEIRTRFGMEDVPVDPVAALSGEVSGLKSGFSEMKAILERIQEQKAEAPQSPPPYQQPAWVPQMVQQPMMQQPMFGAPPLPYIQTPSYTPIMPAIPQFNFNGGNR